MPYSTAGPSAGKEHTMSSQRAWFCAVMVAILTGLVVGQMYGMNAQPVSQSEAMTGLHSGPVAYVYWSNAQGAPEGYTQAETGLPGTSTEVKVSAWATVYPEWVAVQRSKTAAPHFIPRERLLMLQFEK
jgi:hypothetical protein